MTVEGHHDWGCGALNGTALCSCSPKYTWEVETGSDLGMKTKSGGTLSQSLGRLDELQRKIKAGNIDNEA